MDEVSDVTKMREVLSIAKDSVGKHESTNDASGLKKERMDQVNERGERT